MTMTLSMTFEKYEYHSAGGQITVHNQQIEQLSTTTPWALSSIFVADFEHVFTYWDPT